MSLAVRTSKKPAHKQGKAQVREQRAQIQGQVRTNGISRPQIAKPRICKSDFRKFLRGLDEGSTDLVLTDPPYAISRETGFKNIGKNSVERFAVSMDFGPWDAKPIDLAALCDESYRVLRHGGTAIIWYDLWKLSDLRNAMAEAGFKMIRLIIWQKTNPVPLNQSATYLSNSREIAVSGVKGGKPVFNSKYNSGIYEHPIPRHNGKRVHPTQKPIDLFRALVEVHSHAGDLVIDPFLGSGTTAEAAIALNRNFAGCDIDPKYVEASRQRVNDVKDTSLFEKKHKGLSKGR